MLKTVLIEVSPLHKKDSSSTIKQVGKILSSSGIKDVACGGVSHLYRLNGKMTEGEIRKIAGELLCDSVMEEYSINSRPKAKKIIFADVWFKAGVTDSVGDSVLRAIQDLDISSVEKSFSGRRYEFVVKGAVRKKSHGTAGEKIAQFANSELLNPLVQECKIVKL